MLPLSACGLSAASTAADMAFVLFSLGSNAQRHRRIDTLGPAWRLWRTARGSLKAIRWALTARATSTTWWSGPHAPGRWRSARCKQIISDRSAQLDIDILCVDDLTGCIDGVSLPREEITYNAFVLRPLAESFGAYRHPVTNTRYRELWQTFDADSQGLWPVAFEWQGQEISAPEPSAAVTLTPARVR